MEVVGIGKHWDDLSVGQTFRTIGRTITEADIVNFIGVTGMTEVLFTDMEFLKTQPYEGRLAPAALVFCFAEGLLVQSTMQHTGLAFFGMEFEVQGPTVAGDTIHVECEVLEVRPTSKGNRGLVRTRNEIKNQRGETVITYTPLRMMRGRSEAAGDAEE